MVTLMRKKTARKERGELVYKQDGGDDELITFLLGFLLPFAFSARLTLLFFSPIPALLLSLVISLTIMFYAADFFYSMYQVIYEKGIKTRQRKSIEILKAGATILFFDEVSEIREDFNAGYSQLKPAENTLFLRENYDILFRFRGKWYRVNKRGGFKKRITNLLGSAWWEERSHSWDNISLSKEDVSRLETSLSSNILQRRSSFDDIWIVYAKLLLVITVIVGVPSVIFLSLPPLIFILGLLAEILALLALYIYDARQEELKKKARWDWVYFTLAVISAKQGKENIPDSLKKFIPRIAEVMVRHYNDEDHKGREPNFSTMKVEWVLRDKTEQKQASRPQELDTGFLDELQAMEQAQKQKSIIKDQEIGEGSE